MKTPTVSEAHDVVSSDGRRVTVTFYDNGSVRIKARKAAPMNIAQFFATGDDSDVIVLLNK